MTSTPVLIVGAGPTGLVLALSLARRGVRFRIIDDDAGPGPHSRAMAVHARDVAVDSDLVSSPMPPMKKSTPRRSMLSNTKRISTA